jgi:hypothetical protein
MRSPNRRRFVLRGLMTAAAVAVAAAVAAVAHPASAATGSDLQLTVENMQKVTGATEVSLVITNAGPDTLSPIAQMTLSVDVPDTITRIVTTNPFECTPAVGAIGRRTCTIQYSEQSLTANKARVIPATLIGPYSAGSQLTFSMPIAVSLNDPNRFNLVTVTLP